MTLMESFKENGKVKPKNPRNNKKQSRILMKNK